MHRRIIVRHYKSLEYLDLKLGKTTVLVGPNATGKSNVIDCLRFVSDLFRHGLDQAVSDRHGIDSLRQWSPTRPYQVSFEVRAREPGIEVQLEFAIESSQGAFSIVKEEGRIKYFEDAETLQDDDDTLFSYKPATRRLTYSRSKTGGVRLDEYSNARGGEHSTKQFKVHEKDELFVNTVYGRRIAEIRFILSSFESYSIFPNTLRTPQEASNDQFLRSEGRNLCSVFRRMRKSKTGADRIGEILDSMRQVMPNLETINIQALGGFLVPQFRVKESQGRTHTFNVSQISDGTLRVLGTLTALYQHPRPRMIALEEPELTVNPGIITLLADAIKEVSKTTQVLVTTHSPHLIDQFPPEEIRAVEMKNGVTHVKPVRRAQLEAVRQKLFSLGELMTAEGLHG